MLIFISKILIAKSERILSCEPKTSFGLWSAAANKVFSTRWNINKFLGFYFSPAFHTSRVTSPAACSMQSVSDEFISIVRGQGYDLVLRVADGLLYGLSSVYWLSRLLIFGSELWLKWKSAQRQPSRKNLQLTMLIKRKQCKVLSISYSGMSSHVHLF